MKPPSRFITVCTVVGLVVTSIHATNAGSATWSLNPTSNDWKTAANWTPATVPNSATDTATFGNSSITSVNLLNFTTVAEIVFAVGADAFTLNGGAYTTSVVGAGITNDSGITQTLTLGVGGNFNIQNEAAVANTTIVNSGGLIFFWDATTASNSVFTNSGGATDFTDTPVQVRPRLPTMVEKRLSLNSPRRLTARLQVMEQLPLRLGRARQHSSTPQMPAPPLLSPTVALMAVQEP